MRSIPPPMFICWSSFQLYPLGFAAGDEQNLLKILIYPVFVLEQRGVGDWTRSGPGEMLLGRWLCGGCYLVRDRWGRRAPRLQFPNQNRDWGLLIKTGKRKRRLIGLLKNITSFAAFHEFHELPPLTFLEWVVVRRYLYFLDSPCLVPYRPKILLKF